MGSPLADASQRHRRHLSSLPGPRRPQPPPRHHEEEEEEEVRQT